MLNQKNFLEIKGLSRHTTKLFTGDWSEHNIIYIIDIIFKLFCRLEIKRTQFTYVSKLPGPQITKYMNFLGDIIYSIYFYIGIRPPNCAGYPRVSNTDH